MIYANKKVAVKTNIAQQTAQIIANVKELEAKNLISFAGNEVSLYPQIWKDKATALNWIKCLYLYCCLKKKIKDGNPLYFKHIETNEPLGSMVNKKPKVLIFG
ncbi:hypothetical protein VRU48_02935 [Pedobacter sp. KR3-3]|uniref:Uncharacterized protein n=1 Tax=Pedobacter albus TaxID=3113905 RepID=A0ABU7I3R5_9SPHI|nr:hypothetical protein [Pedobacter sp. KR3-3]MEE1944047.1 hypothetical protein [Pedobacter sp. KR3-3]